MRNMSLLLAVTLGLAFTACTHAPTPTASNAATPDQAWSGYYADEFADRAPAADCALAGDWKECKNARRNDFATQYLLDRKGNFFRLVNGQKCQVTANVVDFKISQHPSDLAVVYYKTAKNELFVVHNQSTTYSGNCPPVSKKSIMTATKEFSVVPSQKTTIVNAALSQGGLFQAWDSVRGVYSDTNIRDYMMNQCYGQQGKSFSSVVLFTIDNSGIVTKVRMQSNGFYLKDSSNSTSQRYADIQDFKRRENVCN
jgi:hypothetical protein